MEAWLAGRPWLDGSHGWQAGKPDWEVRLAGWLRELGGLDGGWAENLLYRTLFPIRASAAQKKMQGKMVVFGV